MVGQTSNRLLDPTALLPMMINLDCLIHGVLQCACGFGWMYASRHYPPYPHESKRS
ncbi:hypothetical protein F5Y08DRAFT_296075 [Xylaria arbuscula]|nr:hypothetical protein F5Y08DRAFT_296075 [Xylaria arbuscula]